jgi:hypothetical protein
MKLKHGSRYGGWLVTIRYPGAMRNGGRFKAACKGNKLFASSMDELRQRIQEVGLRPSETSNHQFNPK